MKNGTLTATIWLVILTLNLLLMHGQFSTGANWAVIIGALLVLAGVLYGQLPQKSPRRLSILLSWLVVTLILSVPVGALGVTSWLVSQVTIGDSILRTLYLHRLEIVGASVVIYILVIAVWWHFRLAMRRLLGLPQTVQDSQWRQWGMIAIFAVLNGLLLHFDRILSDRIMGGLLLITTSFLISWITSQILVSYLNLHHHFSSSTVLLLVVGLAVSVGFIALLQEQPRTTTPELISHRGVDGHNGVQNTVASLRQTAPHHPQAIEMDVQETKDHQFVAMHDPNLKALAKHPQTIQELTAGQLTKMTLTEHGHAAKLSGFSDYVNAAEQHSIPLMVEIKPQRLKATGVAERFNEQFGTQLIKSHYRVHSIDGTIINRLHVVNPQLQVGLIRPFSISRVANRQASFYSLDYCTINPYLVRQAHEQGQKVYAWTVNSPQTALRMQQIGVDGIITDDISMIRPVFKQAAPTITQQVKTLLWQLI